MSKSWKNYKENMRDLWICMQQQWMKWNKDKEKCRDHFLVIVYTQLKKSSKLPSENSPQNKAFVLLNGESFPFE